MPQVTSIMPPLAGGSHPLSLEAPLADPVGRDLFALDRIDCGAVLDPEGDLECKARRGKSPKVVRAVGAKPNPDAAAPHLRQSGTKQSGTKYGPPSAILIGEAGANLVLSRLQGWGIPAQIAMPGIAYDLIADIPGLDLLRIQVKTRSRTKGQVCSFTMTRGFYYSKAGMFNYGRDDFDLAAFVCLSIGAVFFCHSPRDYISVPRAWMQSPTIARESFDLALQAIQRRRRVDQLSWLASMNDDAPVAMPAPVPVSTSRPGAELQPGLPQTLEPKRCPVRVPAPPAAREQRAPFLISPSADGLDGVDWDEALAMFSDDGAFDAVIPI